MWTREELKSRAKAGLKQYYWYGLLVTFVAGLLGGNAGEGINISLPAQSGYDDGIHDLCDAHYVKGIGGTDCRGFDGRTGFI